MTGSRPPVRALARGLVFLLLAVASAAQAYEPLREQAIVVSVVDGDTLRIRAGDGVALVRLIGVDTPETRHPRKGLQCFGREATAHARRLLPPGRRVTLEADQSQGDRDRYGRLLRYVWLDDGRNVGRAMIADGYGFEYTYRLPYRYMASFKAAERQARDGERGLWARGACPDLRKPRAEAPAVRLGSAA